MIRAAIVGLLLLVSCHLSSQRPGGAPGCGFNPSHSGIQSQAFPSPYVIVPSVNVIKNAETLTLEIRSSDPGVFFRGFQFQARSVVTPVQIVGHFVETDTVNQLIRSCVDGSQNTVTQTNNADVTSRFFEWTAPSDFTGDIQFFATVVQNFSTFWVNQPSAVVQVVVNEDTTDPNDPTDSTVPIESTSTSTQAPTNDNFYDGCGTTKTCFGIGDGDCVSNRRCNTVGAVIYEAGKFTFEMRSSRAANFIALALSYDDKMGRDSVIECVREGADVKAYASFTNIVGEASSPRDQNQTIIKLVRGVSEDGMIYCLVEREAITTINDVSFNLIEDKHFLLLASGTETKSDSVGDHDINAEPTDEALLLTIASIAQARSRLMLYLHASFMISAWIGLTSIGIFTARFMKRTWINVKVFGKDLWFVTHQTVMILTWFLTLAGFIIIVIDSNRWVFNPHSVLGTIAFALCMIQPFGAVLRPGPKAATRPIFNFLHMSAGNLAHLSAVITMFYAVNLARAQLPDYFSFILIAYTVIYIVFYTSMTVLSFYSSAKEDKLSDSAEGLTSYSSLDAPFSTARKISYVTFVLLMIAFVAGLITVLLGDSA